MTNRCKYDIICKVSRFTEVRYGGNMELEVKTNMAMLYDFYSPMLSEIQKEIMELYYGEDLSLSEISEIKGITRQGVRDAVKKSENILVGCENKLHLCDKFKEQNKNLDLILRRLDELKTDEDISDIQALVKELII